MSPLAVTVRYRFSEDGREDRAASFHGLFYDRSDTAVMSRLRELHRFATRIEVVEIVWPDATGRSLRHAGGWSANPPPGLVH